MSMDLVEGPRAPQKERQRIRGSQGSARLLNVSLAEALVAVAMGSRCRFCDLQSKSGMHVSIVACLGRRFVSEWQ